MKYGHDSNEDSNQEDFDESMQFEFDFFQYIAKDKDFTILCLPDLDGYMPTIEVCNKVEIEANSRQLEVLYRISLGKYATVYNKNNKLFGIVPEDSPNGFAC